MGDGKSRGRPPPPVPRRCPSGTRLGEVNFETPGIVGTACCCYLLVLVLLLLLYGYTEVRDRDRGSNRSPFSSLLRVMELSPSNRNARLGGPKSDKKSVRKAQDDAPIRCDKTVH